MAEMLCTAAAVALQGGMSSSVVAYVSGPTGRSGVSALVLAVPVGNPLGFFAPPEAVLRASLPSTIVMEVSRKKSSLQEFPDALRAS